MKPSHTFRIALTTACKGAVTTAFAAAAVWACQGATAQADDALRAWPGHITPGYCFNLGIEFAQDEADTFCHPEQFTGKTFFDVVACADVFEQDFVLGCEREIIPAIEAIEDVSGCVPFERFAESHRRQFALKKQLCR